MTDSVIRSWVTRIEDYHTVYIMPNAKFTKTARMPRALHGDEWHPLIPSPLRLCHNSSLSLDSLSTSLRVVSLSNHGSRPSSLGIS